MIYLIVSFLVSFITCMVIIKLYIFLDFPKEKRKLHTYPRPRIGGLGIFLAFFITTLLLKKEHILFFNLIISSVPFFTIGLLEDLTQKVSPKWRLLGGFISGILAFFFIHAKVTRVDIPFLDNLLSYTFTSLLFTAFAFAGVGHAFNIIDGFNGLASGVAMLVFGAYTYVSFLHNDIFLVYLNLILISATLGFFLWNYPFGLIFLGDGGAYFLGFCTATIGAMLVNKYPDISPWFPLLLVIYPVWETLFSMYRRKFLKNYPPHLPDAMHFHQLLYRRLLKFLLGTNLEPFKRNSYTSPFLWILELICVFPAVLFWNNTPILIICTFAFIVFYTWLYFRIVKFKTPKIFIRKS